MSTSERLEELTASLNTAVQALAKASAGGDMTQETQPNPGNSANAKAKKTDDDDAEKRRKSDAEKLDAKHKEEEEEMKAKHVKEKAEMEDKHKKAKGAGEDDDEDKRAKAKAAAADAAELLKRREPVSASAELQQQVDSLVTAVTGLSKTVSGLAEVVTRDVTTLKGVAILQSEEIAKIGKSVKAPLASMDGERFDKAVREALTGAKPGVDNPAAFSKALVGIYQESRGEG